MVNSVLWERCFNNKNKITLLVLFDLLENCTVNEAVYFWRTVEAPNNS